MEDWGRKSDNGFLMNTSAPAAFVVSGGWTLSNFTARLPLLITSICLSFTP